MSSAGNVCETTNPFGETATPSMTKIAHGTRAESVLMGAVDCGLFESGNSGGQQHSGGTRTSGVITFPARVRIYSEMQQSPDAEPGSLEGR
jgi:hypothetical protein